jgi:hypothetical protein
VGRNSLARLYLVYAVTLISTRNCASSSFSTPIMALAGIGPDPNASPRHL